MTEIKELKSASEMRTISRMNEDADYKQLREYFIELIESAANRGTAWIRLNCPKSLRHFDWSGPRELYESKLPGMFSRFLDELIEKGYTVSKKELEAEVWWD